MILNRNFDIYLYNYPELIKENLKIKKNSWTIGFFIRFKNKEKYLDN